MTPIEELRHSAAHILATAVLRIFPETKLDIGPPTTSGFYYDFDLDHSFTTEDLKKIENEMHKVIAENQPFERIEITRAEAEAFFKSRQQPYKLERLADIPQDKPITYYRNGSFIDLCAGTHVKSTRAVKAFKLLNVAGAYYRGDEKNKQLQRIYGTAFPDQKKLDNYLKQLEAAKERDHRKLGKELQLFHIDEAVGSGLILWTPKGAILRQQLQNFITQELDQQGYEQVFTPHIGKLDLYRQSGHFPYYQESQYPPIIEREQLSLLAQRECSCAALTNQLEEGTLDGYLLKPMNCPMHIKIFDAQPHSYRDLPVRLAEFGTVYRWEQSGELSGMTRVRGFTQDDAHIFCTEDQLADEIIACLDLVKNVFNTLGMHNYRVRLGLRDKESTKYIGSPENWDKAEEALRAAVKTLGKDFSEEGGEAAFYGPKIDFVVKDVIEREWQLGTVQIDYNLPERFNLSYTSKDNSPCRPVMIHRAPFGSLERFCGLLIEHFAGNFPVWLAPEQIRLLAITDQQSDYIKCLEKRFKQEGIRVKTDLRNDTLGAKIRRAEEEKIPYVGVIGAREAEAEKIALRSRFNKTHKGNHSVEAVLDFIKAGIKNRHLPETF